MLVLPLVRLRTCPDSDRAGIYATFGQHRSWVPSSHRHRIDVLVAWVRIRGVVGGEVLFLMVIFTLVLLGWGSMVSKNRLGSPLTDSALTNPWLTPHHALSDPDLDPALVAFLSAYSAVGLGSRFELAARTKRAYDRRSRKEALFLSGVLGAGACGSHLHSSCEKHHFCKTDHYIRLLD